MSKTIIYTSETCAYCKQVKETFEKNKIDFEERDIIKFRKDWQDVINLTGMANVPAVIYKDQYLLPGRDYQSPEQLLKAVEAYAPLKFSFEKTLLEREKTLNYNIMMAFRGLDQLLRKIETKINTDEHKSTD